MRTAGHIDQQPGISGSHLSRLSLLVFAALFLIGLAEGAVEYALRSPVIVRRVPGTNAITIHVLLAIAAAAAVISIQAWRARHPARRGPSPWTAPFSANALHRLSQTIRIARGLSPQNLARAIATVLLAAVVLYTPFRMGAQSTGGLDPNATINAWGGPSYLGALLAHWLDGLILFYLAAFLLSHILVPAPAEHH